MKPRPLNVLTLQPFYSGSHRQFIDGWIEHSHHHWTLWSLPGRHWKWRMRQAAIAFAERMGSSTDLPAFDCIVATDMLNLAELRGLLAANGHAAANVPMAIYFHENQFEYPTRFAAGSEQAMRDEHFSFTNFISTMAADRIWFNSEFNRKSMLAGLNKLSRQWPDSVPHAAIQQIEPKSQVLYPGLQVASSDLSAHRTNRLERAAAGRAIDLVWAARWEHDKGPAALLETMQQLERLRVNYRIRILGESFRNIPIALQQIQRDFSHRIIQFGYLGSRSEYLAALAASDLFLSTAIHEFFGLSAAEAISLGVRVLLPNRLAYPELAQLAEGVDKGDLSSAEMLYSNAGHPDSTVKPEDTTWPVEGGLALRIKQIADARLKQPTSWLPSAGQSDRFLKQMCWTTRSGDFDGRLADLANRMPQAADSLERLAVDGQRRPPENP